MPIPLVSRGGNPETVVLWDIEDCPVPDGLDAHTVWDDICSALWKKGYRQGRFVATCFGDITQVKSDFGAAGIGITHIPKDERRKVILVKLLIQAIGADLDTSFVLILGDIAGHSGFLRAFKHLGTRTPNRVILAQPFLVSDKLKSVVSSAWLWSNLANNGDHLFHQPRVSRPMILEEGPYKTADTTIFWDVEDCQIPVGLNAKQVLRNIRSFLANIDIISIDDVVPVYAYADPYNHFQGLESLDSVQLFPSGIDKDARLEKILVDFLCCLIDKPHTTNVVLIVGDILSHREYVVAANLLKFNHFELFLAQPQIASEDQIASKGIKYRPGRLSGIILPGQAYQLEYLHHHLVGGVGAGTGRRSQFCPRDVKHWKNKKNEVSLSFVFRSILVKLISWSTSLIC